MKRWKKEYTKLWGHDSLPLHMTEYLSNSLGLLGARGKDNAARISDAQRPKVAKTIKVLFEDIELNDRQLAWCLAQMGFQVEDRLLAMKKDEKTSSSVTDLFERYADHGQASNTPASTSGTHKPLVTPAPSQPASATVHPYAYDGDDDTGSRWQASIAPQQTAAPKSYANYSGTSYVGSPTDAEKSNMRKLPLRPGPYEFPRWKFARTIVVGDLHGCADELLDLLDYVQFKPGEDLLISCGDIVDRGPKISECFEILREYKAWLALGNHEEPFLKWLLFETHPDYKDKWSGKNNPIDFFKRADQTDTLNQLKRADWEDMMKMQLFLRLDWLLYEPLVVHAGLFPNVGHALNKPPEEMDPFSILRMINLDSNYKTLHFSSSTGTPWWDLYDKKPGKHHVIYGHSTAENYVRLRKHSTGLDGGACYGGALTCLVIDGEDDQGRKGTNWTCYSVKARRAHYVSSQAELSGGQSFVFGKVK